MKKNPTILRDEIKPKPPTEHTGVPMTIVMARPLEWPFLCSGVVHDLVCVSVPAPDSKTGNAYLIWFSGLKDGFVTVPQEDKNDALEYFDYLWKDFNDDVRRDHMRKRESAREAEIAALSQAERIALGRAHPVAGEMWRALKNPFIMTSQQEQRIGFSPLWQKTQSLEVRDWLDERDWSVRARRLLLDSETFAENETLRFWANVLDFDEPEHAVEFRLRWL